MKTNFRPVRVAIVEDHMVVRAALEQLLQSDGRYTVVARGADVVAASSLLEQDGIDVLLLDLDLRGTNGLRALELRSGSTPVCILSFHLDPHFVKESLRLGALGYVSKYSAPEELLCAVAKVSKGEPFYSSDVRAVALASIVRGSQTTLTAREREVLTYAANGHTSAEIAAKLFISRRTAEAHRCRFMKKLGLKTQTDLVRYAIRQGIIAA